jgi:hypothetical protein
MLLFLKYFIVVMDYLIKVPLENRRSMTIDNIKDVGGRKGVEELRIQKD